jgi:phage-related protein
MREMVKDSIRIDLRVTDSQDMKWFELSQNHIQWRALILVELNL